jgi:hypothetical protein
MCHKGYLTQKKWNLYFQLKGMGGAVWIPILVIYVFIPFSNFIVYVYRDSEALIDNISKTVHIGVPFFSIWWILFVLEQMIEEPLSELQYLSQRNKLPELIILYDVYQVMLLPLFIVYTRISQDFWWLYLKMAILSIFYFSIVYCLSYVARSIIPSVLTVFLYTIYVMLENVMGLAEVKILSFQIYVGWELVWKLLGYMILSVVLFGIGTICNHKYPEVNRI